MQLLDEFLAGATVVEHLDDATKMAFRAVRALDDLGMGFVDVLLRHDVPFLSLPMG